MAKNRLYYHVKPYLPWRLRMALRGMISRRKRKASADVWPIKPSAAKLPEGWPGWPGGKRFAFILTHDVEGPTGVEKCPLLMQMEQAAGFRSTFNFVPEGSYRVSRGQREELTRNGFEVGVHDLRHDGKLYWTKDEFSRNASRINHYLKEWGASGFRSGFMLHNLEWLHELEARYDASTFDTDPFEPQPDGANTIFPFWVPGPSGGGYVELPYTLPQDSTLFLVFRERTIDIWKRKLDWVAENGGMALLTVHPDYMNFDGRQRHDEYPASFYKEFLEYASSKYQGQFWHTTAKEVAQWYRETVCPERKPEATSRYNRFQEKKVAVLLYSYYPQDPRPRREAEALASGGAEVDLVCLRQNPDEPATEVINGVRVRRVPMSRRREGKLTYAWQYSSFIAYCALWTAWRSLTRKYDLVHVHNMPDVLVFSSAAAKLRGAKVILDLHDPMPELMRTIYGFDEGSKGVRLLKWLEKMSIGFANQVVTVNLHCKKIFAARSCGMDKIQVVMNAPDEKIFGAPARNVSKSDDATKPFVVMYHGSIVERHGLDLAVKAVAMVRQKVPRVELRIFGGRNAYLDSVLETVKKEGLTDVVNYVGPKKLEEIVTAIDECDIGLIPNRRNVFTELNTPTRIFEYLSRGKPVIAPSSSGIVDYFGPNDLLYFELGDAEGMARQIEYAFYHPEEVKKIVERGERVYHDHTWTREKMAFVNSVADLLSGRKRKPVELTQPVRQNGEAVMVPESNGHKNGSNGNGSNGPENRRWQ